MELLWFILSTIALGTVYSVREPVCSRFHYEEKLLEKMIRSEFKMDAMDENLKAITDSIEERFSDITNTMEDLKNEIATMQSADVEISKTVESIQTANLASSSIYTRWGRRSCPGDAELVYEGFAGGGDYSHTGGSSSYVCLPKDPVFDGDGQKSEHVSFLYGAEYESSSATFHANLHNKDVPCAVCRVIERSVLMIPSRKTCYSGWQTEYSGYLMSEYYQHASNKEVVCMDGTPEEAEGNDNGNQNGALFYFVQIKCGALKCPPYRENVALTCVVCSK
ncbi:short-chain collagen C4-like [Mya arenaria]|uniref:short-chain collagen C4-like n=1 Tax=Mya arenaria TaxID=6604 RepID=UPI0022E74836|nr:short-chain collagen C4-like [Mya arenaria]